MSLKKVFNNYIILRIVCIVVACYTGFYILRSTITYGGPKSTYSNSDGIEGAHMQSLVDHQSAIKATSLNSSVLAIVEVWSFTGIAKYLWQHILHGHDIKYVPGIWTAASVRLQNIEFRLNTGPWKVHQQLPQDVQHLVLVLNALNENHTKVSRIWLDDISHLPNLRSATLVLLGSEECKNDWLQNYMKEKGGPLDTVFIVYDTPEVRTDDRFHQWPLGVASYRGFPHVDPKLLHLDQHRNYTCNFLATVYANSSREVLQDSLTKHIQTVSCFLEPRKTWQRGETATSHSTYMSVLEDSDLTLCPVGKNSITYRIYEAISLGSVPVIEDSRTHEKCASPFYILKNHNAPVIWVNNWTSDLEKVFERERNMTLGDKVWRRKLIVAWYEHFKSKLKDEFLDVIQKQIT